MNWPKNVLAVGLYEITITDESAEHSESASFVVTYGTYHKYKFQIYTLARYLGQDSCVNTSAVTLGTLSSSPTLNTFLLHLYVHVQITHAYFYNLEQKTNFSDGSGELTLYAYPFVEGVTVIFAANANVTYQCGIGEAPTDCKGAFCMHF